MPLAFPSDLVVDDARRSAAQVEVRYEDIAQDGRVKIGALPHAMGMACWRGLFARHPISQLGKRKGIVPILSRFMAEGGGGPVSVFQELEALGAWGLAHTVDGDGDVDRLVMILTTEVFGRVGATHAPAPDDAGARVRVGRLYAEHVFTRPFGPREVRRVRALPEGFDLPPVPERRIGWTQASELSSVPPDASPLETTAHSDDEVLCFGLGHTDSNQHVNSLVYPRIFEEAGLRRLRALDRGADGPLPTAMEIAFRKPCFAGDRARVELQGFVDDGRDGVAAALRPAGDSKSLHAAGRVWF